MNDFKPYLTLCCHQNPVIKTSDNMSIVMCEKCGSMSPAYEGEETKGVIGACAAWNRGEVTNG